MNRSPISQPTTPANPVLVFGLSLAGLLGLACTESVDPHQDASVGGSGAVGGTNNAGGATASTNTTHATGGSTRSVGGATATNTTQVSGGSSGSNAGGATASAGKPSTSAGGGSTGSATGGNAGAAAGAGAAGTGTSKACYSPIQNTAHAYEVGAVGCACDPETDVGVCVQGAALVCPPGSDSWRAVIDGPCMPRPEPTYSPTSCTQAGGTPVASPGTPITAEKDCTSGMALGVITSALSGWDEGGLCCAPVKACGARAGDTCSTTQYCAYQAGQYCGQADAQSTCKTRPTACIELNAPVCGCNGKTYGNSCLAAAAGTGVYSNGKCTN